MYVICHCDRALSTRDYVTAPYISKNKNRRLHRHPAFFGTVEDCMEDCCEDRKTCYNNSWVNSCRCRFVLNPRTKRSIKYKTKKTNLTFVAESCVYSISYDISYGGNFLINSAGSSRKIREDKVFPEVLILSTKANGVKSHTFRRQPKFSVPSARMMCSPSSR